MIPAEALEAFLLDLRESEGFAIGLDELLKVRSLLRRLQTENLPEPEALGRLVGPIVCRSGRDQDIFRQRFAQWLAAASADSAVETPQPALPPAEQAHVVAVVDKQEQAIKTFQRWGLAAKLAVGGLLLAVAIMLGVRFWQGFSPTVPTGQTTPPKPVQPTLSDFKVSSVNLERLSLASLPPWLVLAAYAWRRSRYSVLARDLAVRNPNTRSVALEAAWRSLFAGREFRTGLRWLRTYRQIESDTPDIPRSLQSLLRTGYVAELRCKTRPEKPGHLLLVARETSRDHQTALAAVLAEKLREAHVEVTRFDFFRRPSRLRPVRRDGGLRPGNLPLAQLAASHARDRLLILSDGACFFHGLSRQPYPWVKQFDAWEERYLLTPLPPTEWGWRERRLAESGFAVIPSTSRALAAPDAKPAAAEDDWGPYPAALSQATQTWLSRVPDAPGLAVLLAQLELYLGPSGFAWLCACAVFPELHPEITLRLGVALQWRGESLFSEPRLLALSRLPWFRNGEMPRWLRLALIRRLPKPLDESIQTQLRGILTTSRAGQTGPLSLDIAHRDPALGRGLLDALIRREPTGSPLREQIFLDFMHGRRPPEGAVLGSRELEAATGQQSWLPWFFAGGIGIAMAMALWLWLPHIHLPSLSLPRVWAVDGVVYRWTAYFGSTFAALGLLAEFTGLFAGLPHAQTDNWLKPLRWLGCHAIRPAVKKLIDGGLLLGIVAGLVLLGFTFVESYSHWDIPVLSGISASVLIFGLRRLRAGQPPPPLGKPHDPAALLRRPEQLTLAGNLLIAMGLVVALNLGLYDFLKLLSKQRMAGFPNLLSVAALQTGLLLAAPIGAGLFALKTALRLDAKGLAVLVAVAWSGGIAGELAAMGLTRHVDSYGWELYQDFSLEFISAMLFLGVVGIRLGLAGLDSLGLALSQIIGMLVVSAPFWYFALDATLNLSAEAKQINNFFDEFIIVSTVPTILLIGFGYPSRIQILLSRFAKGVLYYFLVFFCVGMPVGMIVPLSFYLTDFGIKKMEIHKWLGVSNDVFGLSSLSLLFFSVPWCLVQILDRPVRRRENFVQTPLTVENRSLPLWLGILACLLSLNFLSGSLSIDWLGINAALIPLAVHVGSRYAWRGLGLLAVGTLPLLFSIHFDFLTNAGFMLKGAGNPGLYVACLLACRLSFDQAWLTRCFTASRWQLADTFLMFAGACLSLWFHRAGSEWNNWLLMQELFFFSIFMLGFSVIQQRIVFKPFVIVFSLIFTTALLDADQFTVWKDCKIWLANVARPDNLLLFALLYILGRWLRIILLCGDLRWCRWSAARGKLSRKWMVPILALCLIPVGFNYGLGDTGVWLSLYNEWILYFAFAAYAAWLSASAKLPPVPAETGISSQPVRSQDKFDVYLSHNSRDKAPVKELADKLKSRGINVWVDEQQLIPGHDIVKLMEEGLDKASAAIVAIGRNGIGPWQSTELAMLQSRFEMDNRPIVPVLLPDALDQAGLPDFLQNRAWVDFRGVSNSVLQSILILSNIVLWKSDW